MSVLLGLLMLQSAPLSATVPVANAERDAANACLVTETAAWLEEFDWQPEEDERWRWATSIADRCADELSAAADSPEAVSLPAHPHSTGLNSRIVLRTEALYYVDRMIREHFEARS